MIHNQDRSGWFGASDTYMIMGNWDTKTFRLWWLEKLGLRKSRIKTIAMQTGTAYEHRILDAAGAIWKDRQIKIRRLRLRVNLDGEDYKTIYEAKTYHKDKFVVTKAYWMQAQVEQFAAHKQCVITAYRLTDEEYKNWFIPVDKRRMSFHPVPYDQGWIDTKYLPRIMYLARCLRRGVMPDESYFRQREVDV